MIKKTISLSMLILVSFFIILISYFHYNQLPIYNWGLAFKFIKNSTQTENFEILSKNLGFSSDEKLLIIHADDLGLSDSVNDTSMESLLKNTVTSASVIMNAEKVQEIADFSKKYPKIDLGVHLTVTSEWKFHKWGGVLSNNDISSLLNSKNNFYWNKRKFTKYSKIKELHDELQAQVDLAISMGMNISHIDSHEGALFFDPDVFKTYLKIAENNNLLAFVPVQASVHFDESFPKPKYAIIIDQFFMAEAGIKHEDMEGYYLDILDNLEPGLSEIIVHFGLNDDKMKEITVDKIDYGSKWREMDYKIFNSEKFINSIKKNNIKLINYKDLENHIR
ncbi:MAG: ChbG/HpnK family deacetylase [Bacteroidota bacterium]|nr:ChbG/HpnK family deacetylase [Bacteroidota bacterium]